MELRRTGKMSLVRESAKRKSTTDNRAKYFTKHFVTGRRNRFEYYVRDYLRPRH